MRRWLNRNNSTHRRGATVVLVAVSMVTLLVCGALAIDVGYICALTAEQQNNSDAGALAGASGLQDADAEVAFHRALRVIEFNQKSQGYLSLKDQIIEFGWWDSVNQVFHTVGDLDEAFAVRVRAARNNAQLFFGGIVGEYSTDVWRRAVAVGSKPCAGIWGLEGVTAGSIRTDSYDSTEGPYDMITAHDNGDICSGRYIDVHGSIEVNGDLMAGLGYDVTVSGNAAQINGLTTSNMTGVTPPPVEFGDVESTNDNATIGLTDGGRSPWKKIGWNMDIQGTDNLTLAPGTYYLDSFTLAGGSTITVVGPTTIYVAGGWDSTGGTIVNKTQNPANLTIISAGSEMKMSGGTSFYGSILAPYADVTLSGNADMYGAIIGKTLTLKGDFQVHVDESLPLAQTLFEPPPPMLVQ